MLQKVGSIRVFDIRDVESVSLLFFDLEFYNRYIHVIDIVGFKPTKGIYLSKLLQVKHPKARLIINVNIRL